MNGTMYPSVKDVEQPNWNAVDYDAYVNKGGNKRMNSNCFRKATHFVTDQMEILFYRLGYQFGSRPWWTILGALVLCSVLGAGLFNWREETDDVNLWTTDGSHVRRAAKWVNQHFTDEIRYETLIVEADNVLRPDVLEFIQLLDKSVRQIAVQDLGWNDLCAKPGSKLKELMRRRRKRRNTADDLDDVFANLFDKINLDIVYDEVTNYTKNTIGTSDGLDLSDEINSDEQISDDGDDFGFDLGDYDFTGVFEDKNSKNGSVSLLGDHAEELLDLLSTPEKCLTRSILEMWDDTIDFMNLSENEILMLVDKKVNDSKGMNEFESFSVLLSGLQRHENGQLESVKGTILNWFLSNDKENASTYNDWELEFIRHTLNTNITVPPGVKVQVLTTRSYDDALAETLTSNMTVLMAGFSIIIVYVGLTMGRLNSVEQRFFLAVAGVSVVGQAILASYGLCFFIGLMYGPVHPILPFLLLGIGVDDMFVIIQAVDNLSPEQRRLPIPERIGLALKHAGVSITVTSITDVVAFGIGATTGMPALRSFCIYATTGILLLFIFVITFFVALAALDERRQDQRRDGCIFRTKQEDWQPSSCSRRELLKLFFEKFYGPLLMKTPTKIFVLVLTFSFASVNIWGLLQLKQDFDPNWYLKDGSHPASFYRSLMEHFPENGERSAVYVGTMDYYMERDELHKLTSLLRENPFVKSSSVIFWHDHFEKWLETKQVDYPSSDGLFKKFVQEFLIFTKDGRQYLHDVKITGSIIDKDFNFNITASRMRFRHLQLTDSTEKNQAIDSLLAIEKQIHFKGPADPEGPIIYTYRYVEWEANKVITDELIRNLGLTLLSVLVVTLVIICDVRTVILVFSCIALTLIDIIGAMYFWGLTIEIVTSILIILSCGLAVDYAAHIGHTFSTMHGSKSERAQGTLTRMGPAVWNGGLSTFLAVVLLANSDSYVFTTFFKLFFSVVGFGLFHGLAYLPVLLSWIGPPPPHDDEKFPQPLQSSPTNSRSSGDDTIPTSISSFPSSSALVKMDDSSFEVISFEEGSMEIEQNATEKSASLPQQQFPQPETTVEIVTEAAAEPYIPQPDYEETSAPVRRVEPETLNVQKLFPRTVFVEDVTPSISSSDVSVRDMSLDESRSSTWDKLNPNKWAEKARVESDLESEPDRPYIVKERLTAYPNPALQVGARPVAPGLSSSQFSASTWQAAFAKKIGLEAASKRTHMRKNENKLEVELEKFDQEMDSYLYSASPGGSSPAAPSSPGGSHSSAAEGSTESGYSSTVNKRRLKPT